MGIGRERTLPSQGDVRRDGVTRRRTLWTAALLAAVGAPVSGAHAQASGEGAIIVTARKRDEDALRVPVVATVLQTEDLERRQVTDLQGVAAMVPGLVLGDAPLEVGTEVSLRGVGSSPLDPGVDQSVALNLDGLPLGQGIAYSVGLFDVERVEVLKGPQPLFFGKNSPGGVIAIRTADPGAGHEVTASAAYEAEAREVQGQIVLSGPVSETLGLRLSSQFARGDGYFRNTAVALDSSGARQPDARFGESRSLYLRLTGVYEPTADLTARLKLNLTHDRVLGGLAEQLVYCPDGTYNYLPTIGLDLSSQYSANEDCRADRKLNIVDMDPGAFPGIPNDGVSFTQTEQRFGTLEVRWGVAPALGLTSVTGYYDLTVDALQNGPWSGGAAPPLAITKALRREEFTQELRLASDFSGTVDFTAGAFVQDGRIRNDIAFLGNRLYGLPAVAVAGSHDIEVRSLALFGQVRARPWPTLEIAAGARWTDEKRSDAPVTYDVFGVFSGVQGTPLHPQLPVLRSRNWSPELTVAWSPAADLTVFGALKQGYKSGSYNINQALNPGDDNSFGDERGRGGEIGIKGYAGGRELSFDLAGYYYRYNGLQVGIIRITSAGIPVLATVNAAAAEVYGTDLALRYRPRAIDGLGVSAALNWNHASFTRFANADCKPGQTVAEGCNLLPVPVTNPDEIAAGYYSIDPHLGVPVRYNSQDLSGTRLHRAPALQATIAVDYETPLRRDLMLGIGAHAQYSSSYVVDLGNRHAGSQGAYGKIGVSFRLRDPGDRWEVALIGNNLTNRLTTGGCLSVNYPGGGGVFPGMITGAPIRGPAGSGETLCGFEQGRELWLRFTART
jgi:outer membrane receptor protein involved in Fe transport